MLGVCKFKLGDMKGSFDAIFKGAEMGDKKSIEVLEQFSQATNVKGTSQEIEIKRMLDSLKKND